MAAAAALVGIGASAMLMAWSPALWPVLLAQSLQGFASCMLNPALAALTLGLVSGAAVAERLGRNARFAAIGSAVGAVLMGVCGTWVSTQAVFWLAALLCVPALIALRSLSKRTQVSAPAKVAGPVHEAVRGVLLDRRLLAYVACAMLFTLANAAMLPLAGVEITKRADEKASLIIAACILVPQFLVALLSPLAGRAAEQWGRRGVLLVGFCALPARAVLLAVVTDPMWIIPVQALDGLGGAVFGVITPLVAADISGARRAVQSADGDTGARDRGGGDGEQHGGRRDRQQSGDADSVHCARTGRDRRGADGGIGDAGDAATCGRGVSGLGIGSPYPRPLESTNRHSWDR